MAKLGKQFQLVVADVVQEMDPNATVREGKWIEGPDGLREIDVIVEGAVDGTVRRVQIECRDYTNEGRPIGIGAIDALKSKHRDLKMDVSLLCSNAGFSSDAVRKARRVRIGLIGVLREDDPRIRYRVFDEVYVRRVECVPNSCDVRIDWKGPVPAQRDLDLTHITYDGAPVFNWLVSRVPIYLGANPVVKGVHSLTFRFKRSVEFRLPNGPLSASAVHIRFEVTGSWIAVKSQIDATSGLYDWVRRTIRLGPGAGRIVFKDVPFGEGGDAIRCPPDFNASKLTSLSDGDVSLSILDLGGYVQPQTIPQLNDFVVDEDLAPIRSGIPPEACYT